MNFQDTSVSTRVGLDGKKLILVVPVLDYGGVESRIVIQSRLMRNYVREMRVCCLSGDGASAREVRRLGVPVDVIGVEPNLRNPRVAIELWRYFKSQKPDIVHSCTGAMTIHATVAAAMAGVPVRVSEEVGIPKRGRIGRVLFPHAYRLATDVVGVSDAVVSYLVNRDGVPPSKAVRIYNTFDHTYLELPRPFPRAVGPLRILSVGRLVPEKSHDVLIIALQRRIREGSAVLSIVGDGPMRPKLEMLVKDLDIGDGITFVGHSTDVGAELMNADVFVLSSSSEGFPLALVEAMGAQLPVIATAVGGIPEILNDVELSKWLIPADDLKSLEQALDRVMALSEEERLRIGQIAHLIASTRFGEQRYLSDLSDMYEEALKRGKNR